MILTRLIMERRVCLAPGVFLFEQVDIGLAIILHVNALALQQGWRPLPWRLFP